MRSAQLTPSCRHFNKPLSHDSQLFDRSKEPEPVRPIVPFDACLARLAAASSVEYFSAATQKNGTATATVKLKTFPPYLVVQVRARRGRFPLPVS
jgi:hypothetical protein